MPYEFRFRRGVASTWAARNPVLGSGEPGLETDTGKYKIGDGLKTWSQLPYFLDANGVAALIDAATLEGPIGPEGKSAYEVAVDNGFSGTQTQWLASLTGPQGPSGQNGSNGVQGVPGIDGQDGESVTVTLVDAADWPPPADSNPLHLYFRVP